MSRCVPHLMRASAQDFRTNILNPIPLVGIGKNHRAPTSFCTFDKLMVWALSSDSAEAASFLTPTTSPFFLTLRGTQLPMEVTVIESTGCDAVDFLADELAVVWSVAQPVRPKKDAVQTTSDK